MFVQVRDKNGVSVGDDEESAGVVVGFASVVVVGEAVAVDAAAGVGALGVGADLRAEAGRVTLVYVLAVEAVGVDFLAGRAEAERSVWSLLAAVGAKTSLVLTLCKVAACTCKSKKILIKISPRKQNS